MRKKISFTLILLFAFAVINTGFVNTTTAQDSVSITLGTTDSISSLDPADAYDYFSSNLLVQLTHGLMEMPVDSTTAEAGPIVESFTVDSTAQIFDFTLKEGIMFSDGEPFDADAMVWNLERSMNINGQPGFLLTDVVDTVEATGDYTLRITLSKADATFLQRLTYTVAWPVSPESLSATTIEGQPDSIPAGLGPYMVDSWTKDNELVLVPNPHYFGDAPKNDEVIIRFYSDASTLLIGLETGEIDVAQKQFGPDQIEDIMANDDLEYQTKATAGIRYLILNVEEHTDVNVRQAIASAIDRTDIVNTVYAGLNSELYSMVPSIFDSQVDAFDDGTQAQVEGNMTAAGYSTTNKYELDFWYSPSHYGSEEVDVAELIKEDLESTGYFTVNLQNAEWSTYVGQLTTMGFFLLGWWFDYPDPSNYIDPFVGSGAFSLGTNYTSTEMDGYIDTMLTDPDQADRDAAVANAQNLMAEDVPLVPLVSMIEQFSAYQPGIEGVVLEPSENMHYNSIYQEGGGGEPEPAPSFGLTITLLALFVTIPVIMKARKKPFQ